jgi:dTDP-4-dehydrorhamnose 3,5-epimerase
MKLIETRLPGVMLIEPVVFEDARGWFMESFNERNFHAALTSLNLPVPSTFVQDNHSCSQKGVLRGLHYQLPPYAQGKLVRVVQGSIYDVAVDIRSGSETLGQHVAVKLSSENKHMLWVPEGFAHGFLALEPNTHLLYKTTNFYCKAAERSLRWNDRDLDIKWPLDDFLPQLDVKDEMAAPFSALALLQAVTDT